MSFKTYTKKEAKTEIQKLVDKFHTNIDFYKSNGYKEAQMEDEFLKPFLSFLNWNIHNEEIHSLVDREVIVQAKGKKGKEPDYLLQLEGKPAFYIEAKHPKFKLWRETKYIWQAYSYAYSTQSSRESQKVDFSLLTDFEEFRFFDCTFKSKNDLKLLNKFATIDWTYQDYISKFDELWHYFEKENVRKGSLKNLYLTEKEVNAKRTPPDKAFLEDLDHTKTGWRIKLAKDIHKFNENLSSEYITTVVQLILDRFIFIKVLSDREIEDDFLSKIIQVIDKASLKSERGLVNETCKELFEKLNSIYNGSIFHHREELDNIFISNKTLHQILKELLPENSRYNFKQIPVEILGSIYEQFLGKIVTFKNKKTHIEEKLAVRKTGGVYYTPQYIVDYIVENTVGKKLSKCKNIKDILNIKICDPACGSGSFLLGAYGKIISWCILFYGKQNRKNKGISKYRGECFYENSQGEIRLTSKLKREILQHCIHGVDIDQQAVELCKTSLSLKMLEDTRHDELYNEVTLFHQQVLPNLDKNIKCGNSLISTDIYDGKFDFSAQEEKKLNPFNWKEEFKNIFTADGFDCVIGNPPYRREKDFKKLLNNILLSNLGQKYQMPRMDLWYYFAHRGVQILNQNGFLSFIVNSYWLNSTGSAKLINDIKNNTSLEEIFLFNNLKIFQNVSGQHLIFRLYKKKSLTKTVIKHVPINKKLSAHEYILNPSKLIVYRKKKETLFDKNKIDIRPNSDILNVIQKHLCLEEYGLIKQGIAENPANINKKTNEKYKNKYTLGEGVFTLTNQELQKLKLSLDEMSFIKPYHDLCDLGRYIIQHKPSLNLLYFTKKNCSNINKYPNLKQHLKRFKIIMDERRETKKGSNAWWHLHWPRDENIWNSPKILSVQMGIRPAFVPAINPVYVSFSINVFIPNKETKEHLNYFTGILNSKLLWKWFSHKAKKRGIGLEINGNVLSKAPIKKIDFNSNKEQAQHDKIVALVNDILVAQRQFYEAKTEQSKTQLERKIKYLDNSIDELVYQLYELTDEEIKIIEEG